mmetsp:Transcript_52586/g.161847  ORF Transcript_52586/g.161847 Transcript_52586/m.161847 type:complete len:328 (-) Transcript_52586:1436-2419(-)
MLSRTSSPATMPRARPPLRVCRSRRVLQPGRRHVVAGQRQVVSKLAQRPAVAAPLREEVDAVAHRAPRAVERARAQQLFGWDFVVDRGLVRARKLHHGACGVARVGAAFSAQEHRCGSAVAVGGREPCRDVADVRNVLCRATDVAVDEGAARTQRARIRARDERRRSQRGDDGRRRDRRRCTLEGRSRGSVGGGVVVSQVAVVLRAQSEVHPVGVGGDVPDLLCRDDEDDAGAGRHLDVKLRGAHPRRRGLRAVAAGGPRGRREAIRPWRRCVRHGATLESLLRGLSFSAASRLANETTCGKREITSLRAAGVLEESEKTEQEITNC